MRMHLGVLLLTLFVVNTLVLAGCLPPPGGPEPRHYRGAPPPPPPEGQPPPGEYNDRNPPPPDGDRTPPPPDGSDTDRTRAVAPPAHQHGLTITLSTTTASPGSEVSLYLNRTRTPLIVYFNGRILPKRTDPSGMTLTVTLPADATSGTFEIEWSGQRYQSPYLTVQ